VVVETHDGLHIVREDQYRGPFGVNGSKYRTWKANVGWAADRGHDGIVIAGSVHAPTIIIGAVAAMQASLYCTVIVGGTTVEKALRHPYVRGCHLAGANIEAIPVGYAPALKKAARTFEAGNRGTWRMAPPEPGEAREGAFEEFLGPVGDVVKEIPRETETLVIPFGSGNTAAGIFYGLAAGFGPPALKRVVLIGIGPDRLPWLHEMLNTAGVGLEQVGEFPFEVVHLQTHPWFAEYGDRMPEQFHGITMHPTYEGKVIRYLNLLKPDWWTRRDGTTTLWIVGGPIV